MTIQPPEFHTEPTTPISPVPHYPPAPSKLPVLENQIDPLFNLTSTHTKPRDMARDPDKMDRSSNEDQSSSSDENNFSDPFESEQEPSKPAESTSAPAGGDTDDDYAMTFESEADGDVSTNESPKKPTAQKAEQPAPVVEDPPVPQVSTAASSVAPISQPTNVSSSIATQSAATAVPPSARAPAPAKPYRPSTPPAIYQSIQKGEIDIQELLDNITANAELKSASNGTAPAIPLPVSSAGSHANLPPRPPVVPQTAVHPVYAAPPGYNLGPAYPGPPGVSHMPPSMMVPAVAAPPPGTHLDPRAGLPPPPAASFVAPPSMPFQRDPTIPQARPVSSHTAPSLDGSDAGDYQWTRELQKQYEAFLADERQNVSDGVWDRFPEGSRLFIGNLVTEKVSKRDVFHLFHKYGKIAQISIKQAYGFVQFYEVSSCSAALAREQGQELRGRKIHLEISKRNKNSAKAQSNQGPQNAQRRSNTPERMRGNNRGSNNRNHQQNRNSEERYDRYDGRGGPQYRDQDYRQGPPRGRDDYRPMRSPSPPRGGYRGRDDRDFNRRGDHYSGGDYRRSRSRSPVYNRRDDRRDIDRFRQRSPSPRRPVNEDEALAIPRRAPADVPDVQIFLLEELDRNFIQWVENEIKKKGLKTEVMFLSPRLPVDVVIRRQILEGVTAVVRLTRSAQNASKIPLQVFDRSRGADNVKFDEYENLDPSIAAELVIREKAKLAASSAPAPQQYAPQPPAYSQQQQPAAAPAPNLTNIVGQLDNATLQQLLGSLGGAPAPAPAPVPVPAPQQAPANGQFDLAGILGMLNKQQQQQQQFAPPPVQQGAPQNAAAQQMAAQQQLTAMLANAGVGRGAGPAQGQMPAQQGQQSQQQAAMDIMAQLARLSK